MVELQFVIKYETCIWRLAIERVKKWERERSFKCHKKSLWLKIIVASDVAALYISTYQQKNHTHQLHHDTLHTHTQTQRGTFFLLSLLSFSFSLYPFQHKETKTKQTPFFYFYPFIKKKKLKKKKHRNRKMLEAKDPAIKLFGKTIAVPDIPSGSGDSDGAPASSSGDVVDDGVLQNPASSGNPSDTNMDGEEREEIDEDAMGEEQTEGKKEDGALTQISEKTTNLDTASRSGEESINPSTEEEAVTLKTSKTKEEQAENSQDKTLKKPDKILPCPRCNSMDTKFCYYNNYNVNQPRHFCKNCQRYWTAGGAMRNVPVGAGRRKNKNSSSHYRQITVTEAAVQNSQVDLPNGVRHPSLNGNAAVFTFGSDTPLCESMTSVLNLADKAVNNCTRNGFNGPEELRIPVPYAGGENINDHSNKSSVESTKPTEDATANSSREQVIQNCQSFPPQVPYYPGAPWLVPWNPGQWSSPVPPSAFFPQGFAMPLYPAAAYWGFPMPGAWNNPWLAQPSSPNSTVTNSGPNSPTLGKHSREENTLKCNDAAGSDEHGEGNNKEKSLWVPKTLRIDDLGEAEKSSMLTTLGIKNNKADSIHGGGLFKAFSSKGDEKAAMQKSPALQANPAALSRSINFHETS